ncbi:radical SAM/SPASM domain-containing protein [Paraprevotella clara]|uniref:radical SAM/SPASM domain-containing protein n=1 Tax=Paraprevotella clara TaxID=454154 RepID=UPI0026764FC0|nr:radical SAM protein [Paraprevotella clara]
MKTSKYNYYIDCNNKYLFFNGLSKNYFEVSEENHESFRQILMHPNDYAIKYAHFLSKMKEFGFVLDDEVDEFKKVVEAFTTYKQPDTYNLMVMPTYNCNLSCWYCIQHHQNVNLTESDIQKIKEHIKAYLLDNKLKKFNLSWFGGEPLLKYNEVIDLTKFSFEFCKQNHICFESDITTNGILLTEKRIYELKNYGVKSFQITIDGCREKHNTIKRIKNVSTFDVVLKNILSIVKMTPESECILRLNYDENNLEPEKIIKDINELIPKEYRNKIVFLSRKIWQKDERNINKKDITQLIEDAKESQYVTNSSYTGLCYVDYQHFNCVFPNGNIGKCDNEILDNAQGHFTDNYEIEWEETPKFIEYNQFSKDSPCSKCKHLPFCCGPCPNVRDNMIKQFNKIICQYSNPEKEMEEQIIRYCETNIKIS